jgi:hypothetical protein
VDGLSRDTQTLNESDGVVFSFTLSDDKSARRADDRTSQILYSHN